ncbi:MAG: hypothetical protein JRN19_00340 [Nitrososphaerota archaeon]|nr:hypothetical protein [Nitrososphaerota archaeon]MDG7048691.1 hypothetical protein [Nitrososphaerota archaeon]MDG7050899.1 hypothetical protein [Nitrososphaerota archaeon]
MKWGQHFISNDWAKRVVDLIDVQESWKVFEIGTGGGQLTRQLAERGAFVRSVELDESLFTLASYELMYNKRVKIIKGNALLIKPEIDERVVTDLPFYISRKFIEWLVINNVEMAFAILQKEFAEKIVANPGERDYKAVSALAKYTYEIKAMLDIPSEAYKPMPPVSSRLMRFIRNQVPPITKEIVLGLKKAFSSKNKNVTSLGLLGYRKVFELEPEELIDVARRIQAIR